MESKIFFFNKQYKFCFEQKRREKNDALRPKKVTLTLMTCSTVILQVFPFWDKFPQYRQDCPNLDNLIINLLGVVFFQNNILFQPYLV